MDRATELFAIRFTNGYHAVKHCFNSGHAHERAREEHPNFKIDAVVSIDQGQSGWYQPKEEQNASSVHCPS